MQRILTFYQQKNNSVFVIFMFEISMNCYLTMSLILNNWAMDVSIMWSYVVEGMGDSEKKLLC